MILDYKILNLDKNKGLFEATTPCDLCASAACVNSKVAFYSWIKHNGKDDKYTFSNDKNCEDICFKNFPNLLITEKNIKNCTFENCQTVIVKNCKINNSEFDNVSKIESENSDFTDCIFSGCCSQGSLLTLNGKGSIQDCAFNNNIALTEDGYLIHMIFDNKDAITKIRDCNFTYNTVENPDGELVRSEYLEEVSFKKSVLINNVDYETCGFVDDEGDAIEIGSFDLDVPEGDYDGIEIIGSFVSEED